MPLDGLRAWIGEVERKLGMRTRVFLVLATIAIGGAGAAIYLALDTRDDAVSESDVQALQERLEERLGAGATSAPLPPAESPEPESPPLPPAESAEPEPLPEPAPQPKPESGAGETNGSPGGVGTSGANGADLPKQLEEAKRKRKEAEQAE
jgi:hypothetical protein